MLDAFSKVSVKDNMPEVKKIFADLAKMDVLVGIPEEKSSRENGEITNAELAFIHTHGVREKSMRDEMEPNIAEHGYNKAHQMYIKAHGSPLMQIPARPIIEAAIECEPNKKIIGEALGTSGKKAMDGNRAGAEQGLEIAGMTAQNLVRGWWDNPANKWPENAESTVKEKGSDKPLVDEGELRKSISYVVRKE